MIVWSQEAFSRFYGGPDGAGLGSTFAGDGKWWKNYYEQRIVPIFGQITGAQRILVVGCGLGHLVASPATGFGGVWGIDSSPYVASLWPTDHPKLGAYDIRTVTDQQMRSLTGSTAFDWVLSESVLESYQPGQEQEQMYGACESRLDRRLSPSHCVHLVYEGVDMTRWPENALENGEFAPWAGQPLENPGCPPRTLEEWRASRPSHTFLSLLGVGV